MAGHTSTNPAAGQDLIRKVEELESELAQARQQQAAANEILHAISRSRADVTGITYLTHPAGVPWKRLREVPPS